MGEKPNNGHREQFSAYVDITGPVFYNRQLSDKAKLLYGLLSAMTRPPDYYAWARNATMCGYLGCCERTLQRYLKELTDAGELTIEDGSGGNTIRKIRVARLQPVYPAESCGGTPTNPAGAYNKENKKNKKNTEAAAISADELDEHLTGFVARLELTEAQSTTLITDLRGQAENRKAKGKPILSYATANRMMSRLLSLTEKEEYRPEAMRYILQASINNNWTDVFPIKDSQRDDFLQFVRQCRGMPEEPEAEQEGSRWL